MQGIFLEAPFRREHRIYMPDEAPGALRRASSSPCAAVAVSSLRCLIGFSVSTLLHYYEDEGLPCKHQTHACLFNPHARAPAEQG